MKTITIILALVLSASAFAQAPAGLTLGSLCATADVPSADEYNAQTHADNFCALATHEPSKAVAQLGKMIRTTRARENRNRFYFDPKRGADPRVYIQLLRPWMVEQNVTGNHDWQIFRRTVYEAAHADYGWFDDPDATDSMTTTRLHRLGHQTGTPLGGWVHSALPPIPDGVGRLGPYDHPLTAHHRIYAIDMKRDVRDLGPCGFRSLTIVEGSVVRQKAAHVMRYCPYIRNGNGLCATSIEDFYQVCHNGYSSCSGYTQGEGVEQAISSAEHRLDERPYDTDNYAYYCPEDGAFY